MDKIPREKLYLVIRTFKTNNCIVYDNVFKDRDTAQYVADRLNEIHVDFVASVVELELWDVKLEVQNETTN